MNVKVLKKILASTSSGSGFKGSWIPTAGHWFLAAAEGCPTHRFSSTTDPLTSDICLPLINL